MADALSGGEDPLLNPIQLGIAHMDWAGEEPDAFAPAGPGAAAPVRNGTASAGRDGPKAREGDSSAAPGRETHWESQTSAVVDLEDQFQRTVLMPDSNRATSDGDQDATQWERVMTAGKKRQHEDVLSELQQQQESRVRELEQQLKSRDRQLKMMAAKMERMDALVEQLMGQQTTGQRHAQQQQQQVVINNDTQGESRPKLESSARAAVVVFREKIRTLRKRERAQRKVGLLIKPAILNDMVADSVLKLAAQKAGVKPWRNVSDAEVARYLNIVIKREKHAGELTKAHESFDITVDVTLHGDDRLDKFEVDVVEWLDETGLQLSSKQVVKLFVQGMRPMPKMHSLVEIAFQYNKEAKALRRSKLGNAELVEKLCSHFREMMQHEYKSEQNDLMMMTRLNMTPEEYRESQRRERQGIIEEKGEMSNDDSNEESNDAESDDDNADGTEPEAARRAGPERLASMRDEDIEAMQTLVNKFYSGSEEARGEACASLLEIHAGGHTDVAEWGAEPEELHEFATLRAMRVEAETDVCATLLDVGASHDVGWDSPSLNAESKGSSELLWRLAGLDRVK